MEQLGPLASGQAGTRQTNDPWTEARQYVSDPCRLMTVQKLKKVRRPKSLNALPNSEIVRLLKQHGPHSRDVLINSTFKELSGQKHATRQTFYRFALTACSDQIEQVMVKL